MHYEIKDESGNGWFVLKMAGRFSVDQHVEMYRDLISHPHWKKGMNMLADIRGLSGIGVNVGDVMKATEVVLLLKNEVGSCRHAVVCPEKGRDKVAMLHFVLDGEVDWVTKLFDHNQYEDAIAWLESGDKE